MFVFLRQVLISTDEEDTWIIKVLLRETRAPELGVSDAPLWGDHIVFIVAKNNQSLKSQEAI